MWAVVTGLAWPCTRSLHSVVRMCDLENCCGYWEYDVQTVPSKDCDNCMYYLLQYPRNLHSCFVMILKVNCFSKQRWLVFIMETYFVFCEVGFEFLSLMYMYFDLTWWTKCLWDSFFCWVIFHCHYASSNAACFQ